MRADPTTIADETTTTLDTATVGAGDGHGTCDHHVDGDNVGRKVASFDRSGSHRHNGSGRH